MKNILVTGGAGYIGSHTCKALSLAGYNPIVYDNLVTGHEWAVKWGPLEIGALADKPRLSDVLHKYRPDAVLHFAAFAYVGESMEQPLKYYQNNVAGTLTLLESMREHDINKLVFSSTCATYGVPIELPISDTHPQLPVTPYGMSKLMVERILADSRASYGLNSISLRYFNAAGADPAGEIGEVHDPETHLIPLLLDVAIGKRPHLTVFGDDYDTPDGTCIRDYVHVSDLAHAHVQALHKLEDNSGRRSSYNLGNGSGFSVKEVIAATRRITGHVIPVLTGPRRQGDPPFLVSDSKNAVSELKWDVQFAGIEKIIGDAWRWRQRFNSLQPT